MYKTTITNPKTNRENRLDVYPVNVASVRALLRDGTIKTARDLSWLMLEQDERLGAVSWLDDSDTIQAAESRALRIFEQALDWGLGLAALGFMRAVRKEYNRYPKDFAVGVNGKGDTFILDARGNVIPWSS